MPGQALTDRQKKMQAAQQTMTSMAPPSGQQAPQAQAPIQQLLKKGRSAPKGKA
jgi:hypothetical protein